jgi:hypothetical protein
MFQVRLRIDLRDGKVQSPLNKVRPDGQRRILDGISIGILYRLAAVIGSTSWFALFRIGSRPWPTLLVFRATLLEDDAIRDAR